MFDSKTRQLEAQTITKASMLALLCAASVAVFGCSSENPNPSAITPNAGNLPAGRTIALTATEFKFTPNAVTASAGEQVTFMLHNAGTMQHGLNVDLPAGEVALPSLVSPGGMGEVNATMPSAPGTFQFFCPVPGHKQLGMVGTLTVQPAAGTGSSGATTGGATSGGATSGGATSGGATSAGATTGGTTGSGY